MFYNSSAWSKAQDEDVRNVLKFIYELKAESGFTKKLEQEVIESRYSALKKDEYMYFSDVLEEEKEEARAIGLAEGRGFIKRTNFRFTINYIKVTLSKIKAAFFLHS